MPSAIGIQVAAATTRADTENRVARRLELG
jgi:hypothetical protein